MVCDDEWSMVNTHVACAELGYTRGISFMENYDASEERNLTSLPVVVDNVRCHEMKNSLFLCR